MIVLVSLAASMKDSMRSHSLYFFSALSQLITEISKGSIVRVRVSFSYYRYGSTFLVHVYMYRYCAYCVRHRLMYIRCDV